MWETIKVFPYPGYHNIEATTDKDVESFLCFNTQAVKIVGKKIGYDNLKTFLSRFHQLTVVVFTSIDITPKMAKKLTCCISRYHRSSGVILYLKSNGCDAFSDALTCGKERRVVPKW